MLFLRPHGSATDAELVDLVAQGSESAFKELLTRYQKDVYQLICRFLRDTSEVEDIT